MKKQWGDKIRLQHILDAITETQIYLDKISYEQFMDNSEKRFATIKQIEIIGEACNALTKELKETHANIPWKSIIGFRNISIHEYFGVDFQVVWEIATIDLPVLQKQIQKILKTH